MADQLLAVGDTDIFTTTREELERSLAVMGGASGAVSGGEGRAEGRRGEDTDMFGSDDEGGGPSVA